MKIIAAFIMSGVLLGGCASFDVHERRLADYQRECSRDGISTVLQLWHNVLNQSPGSVRCDKRIIIVEQKNAGRQA